MSRRWIHLITVGASLAQNALRRGVEGLRGVGDLKALEEGLSRGGIGFESLVGEVLSLVLEEPRSMSAELNTSLDLVERGYELRRIQLVHLFHTDTWIGRLCGRVLRGFFEEVSRVRFNGLVACPQPIEVEGLGSHERFREGLANLLWEIAGHIKVYKDMGDRVFIHATGGFKPESAIALLAANLPGLGAPVYYIHEYFKEVVRIPAIPISPRRIGVFTGLMDRVLQVGRVHRLQLEEEFRGDLVEEGIKLGWLMEEGDYIKPSAMGRLIWRILERLKTKRVH